MDTNFYDVVVCGGATSGLVAGALLARRGFRVLLLGHEPRWPRSTRPVRRCRARRRAAADGSGGGVPIARVFKELDCGATVKRRTRHARRPSFRIVLPGQKLDRHARSGARWSASWRRAFGAASAAGRQGDRAADDAGALLDPLFASAITLPPNGFWERREVGRLQSLLPNADDGSVRAAAVRAPVARDGGGARASTGRRWSRTTWARSARARAFDVARRGAAGVRRRPGRPAGDVLLGRLDNVRRRPARAPDAGRGRRAPRPRGRRARPPARRDHRLPSPAVGGSAASLVAALAPDAAAPHNARRRARHRATATRSRCSSTPRHCPDGMPARILAIGDPSRPLTEDNAVAITIGPPRRRRSSADADLGRMRRARQPGRRRTELPARAARPRGPHAGPAAPRLRAARRRVGVALRRAARPSAAAPCPERRRPRRAALLPPALVTPAGASARSTSSACATRPAVKHLYLVGRENLPGLGLEGELHLRLGRRAAGELADRRASTLSPRRILDQRRVRTTDR